MVVPTLTSTTPQPAHVLATMPTRREVTPARLRVRPDSVVLVDVCSQYAGPVSRLHPLLAVRARSSNGREVHFGVVQADLLWAMSSALTERHRVSPRESAGSSTAASVRPSHPAGCVQPSLVPSLWPSQYAAS